MLDPDALPAIGRVGLWTNSLDSVPLREAQKLVAEIEGLGYGALWYGESFQRDAFVKATLFLEATSRLVVATGIVNIWLRHALATAAAARALANRFPGRFLLGLGASHEHIVGGLLGASYERPLEATKRYLDDMDRQRPVTDSTLRRSPRVLAALGPKMLALARDRADGAHPYLVTPEHTARARKILGPGKLLAVEQAVVLSGNRGVVRQRSREHLERYLRAPNYRNNWLRLGFTEADFRDGGSDRLLGALVAGGDEETIRRRVHEHLEAGADHVCIQPLGESPATVPADQWRTLASVLL